jgi:hypothetical protein
VREVVVPENEVGIELDGATEKLFRFGKTSLVAVRDPQVRVKRGVRGIELEGAAEGGGGSLEILELSQGGAEISPGRGELGKKLDRLPELSDGTGDVIPLDQGLTKLVPGAGEVGVELDRAFQNRKSFSRLESARVEDERDGAFRSLSNGAIQMFTSRGGLRLALGVPSDPANLESAREAALSEDWGRTPRELGLDRGSDEEER